MPFEGRGRRVREHAEVLRRLWREDVSSFDGEFIHYEAVRSYPKPVRGRQIPVVIGGNSDPALRRVVAYSDGWYGFSLTMAEVRDHLAVLVIVASPPADMAQVRTWIGRLATRWGL